MTRFGGTQGDASVRVVTRDGTGINGIDYGTTNLTLVWANGEDGPRRFSVPLAKERYEQVWEFYVDITDAKTVTPVEPMTATVVLGGATLARPSIALVAALLVGGCLASVLRLAP